MLSAGTGCRGHGFPLCLLRVCTVLLPNGLAEGFFPFQRVAFRRVTPVPGHRGSWHLRAQGAAPAPRGTVSPADSCPWLCLGPLWGDRTHLFCSNSSSFLWFSNSLPSPMRASHAAEQIFSCFGGKFFLIATKHAPTPGPRERMLLPARLPWLQDGVRWHLHFLPTRAFLLASAWPLIFLAPSPCRSSDLFTPARISEVQMYMCFPLR